MHILTATRRASCLIGLLVALLVSPARAQAPAPEWLARLFPHTEQPDTLAHRLRRLEASEFEVQGQRAGSVTV